MRSWFGLFFGFSLIFNIGVTRADDNLTKYPCEGRSDLGLDYYHGVIYECNGQKLSITKKSGGVDYSLLCSDISTISSEGCNAFKSQQTNFAIAKPSKIKGEYSVSAYFPLPKKEETPSKNESNDTDNNVVPSELSPKPYVTDLKKEHWQKANSNTENVRNGQKQDRSNLSSNQKAIDLNTNQISNNEYLIEQKNDFIEQKENEIKALKKQKGRLSDKDKETISKLNGEIDGAKKEITALENSNNSFQRQNKILEKQSNKSKNTLDKELTKAKEEENNVEQNIVSDITEDHHKRLSECQDDACKEKENARYKEEIEALTQKTLEETWTVDTTPSKEFDNTFFGAYVGNRIFPDNYCPSVWEKFQENPENLKKFLDGASPSSGTEPGSCERYSLINIEKFYSEKRTLKETAKLLNPDVLCVDTALPQGSSCKASADKYVKCSKITTDTVKQLRTKLCNKEEFLSVNPKEYGEYRELTDACKFACETDAKEELSGCFASANYEKLSEKVEHCFAYKSVATINFEGDSLDNSDLEYPSFDGKYTCQRTSPFTADYKYCKKLVIAYNAAFAAEQAMGMAEGIQRSVGQANAMGEYAKAQASGNGQLGGLEGMKSIAKTNESIETQKAALYTAQFGVFAGMMISWPTQNNIVKTCEKAGVEYSQECSNAVHFAGTSAQKIFFPNYGVKQAFYAELIKAAGNSAVAWIKRNMYRKQQRLVDEVKDTVAPSDEGGGFAVPVTYCQQYPNAVQCRGRGNRVSVDGYSGGGLNLVGGGTSDYGFTSDDDLGEYNEGRDTPSNATIDDITSMLGDSAEKGSSDFDKVAGAKVTESAAGGSGGGGPGGGGGGASLASSSGGGGADGEQKADGYGVTRSGANYVSSGGAAGYTGSKAKQFGKDKKVDNPFSSLFGAKKNSRNVASDTEDIAPKESSLFKKISNRYTEVKNQKRLLDTEVK